ncbi:MULTISPECIES: DNA polymerase III subunit delta [Corynebacterium]|uniref:DNA polymerase III subunit delta n=1 Tax=Corynebacterium TaxID=1716 RepID=UPI000ECC2825|nr:MULTISPECIES: DNA polymerase III subunit delta [Corynebacterium]MDN6099193.1 DNA polymerase III subunit delta [Corynebacterium flavescens]MDN6199794.1 DNA polymerase III subunit delta [Corynebacterium flavescens]MDN6227339.1 DNA polymerase III subunit delta [Corynebacterium flavescens]MDN6236272.1 DNA polymerase III subunit delta [Corynebacterium flavescens]MDN6431343.1 DNA polymerase III subunit delta [Corynebacterium flavescens]
MAVMPVAPVHLILGDDEFLTERARLSIQSAAAQDSDTALEVKRLKASEVSEGEIAEATSPSLFGDNRVIVVSDVERAGKEVTKILLEACVNPAPGMTMVIVYTVSAKTLKAKKKAPEIVSKLRKIGEVHEAFSLYTNELLPWATREFASHGVRPTPDVVQAVLDGVGSDLRELASAISQLVFDTNGNVTREAVHNYYVGVAEVANWDIADAAVAGRLEAAVSTCRRALQLGASPVAIAAALANKVGAIARLYSARGDQFSLAKQTGLNAYVVKLTQPVARRWSGENVTRAVILVSELEAEVKGRGGDPDFAIEAAVRRIAELAR